MSSVVLPRPAERFAIVSMVLIFLCGGVAGAMVMSFLLHPGIHGGKPATGGFTISTREWQQELDLSAEQNRQLNSILDDFSRYYDNLLSDGNSRVLQILNSEQKKKFEKMMREHKR